MAFQLDDNAVSGMIAAGNGYYFIKCLNKYNEELTEANKSNIVEKRGDDVRICRSMRLNTRDGNYMAVFFAVFVRSGYSEMTMTDMRTDGIFGAAVVGFCFSSFIIWWIPDCQGRG